MIANTKLRLLSIIPATALLAACSGAGADAPPVIKERHDNFEAIGDSFKAIRAQFEGTPDLAVVEAEATNINERAQLISGHFPEGTGMDAGYDTEALPTIWEKPDEFEAAQQRLIDQSAAMASAAATGDAAATGELVKELGGACKNCHDTFRKDDD